MNFGDDGDGKCVSVLLILSGCGCWHPDKRPVGIWFWVEIRLDRGTFTPSALAQIEATSVSLGCPKMSSYTCVPYGIFVFISTFE